MVEALRVRGVTVTPQVASGPESRFVQVDGELLGPLPVSFECVPVALSLVVP